MRLNSSTQGVPVHSGHSVRPRIKAGKLSSRKKHMKLTMR